MQFVQMMQQYERLVYTICFQFTKNHHVAEDLTQETFISAYAHRDVLPLDHVKPWLARIATNKAKDYLKSAYSRKTEPTDDSSFEQNATVLFAREECPEALALSKETVQEIQGEILALKEPYRQVATLFFLQDKQVGEIAHMLKRPEKTVYTQLYRSKQILKEKLQRRE